MKIAILGATSQIAKDLIKSMIQADSHQLYLYARQPHLIQTKFSHRNKTNIEHTGNFESFDSNKEFDALINFVGVGNPASVTLMGSEIFDVTLRFDQLAINYIRSRPQCRYIFLSSGAAYGNSFNKPVDENSQATLPINIIKPQDWYGVAKLYAECLHRACTDLSIIDVRIFNYFSSSQDLDANFLMCDVVKAIRDRTVLRTDARNIVRDYLTPQDFHSLIEAVLDTEPTNNVVDAYSLSPVDKFTLLSRMNEQFGLKYEIIAAPVNSSATGVKVHYYSLNTRASQYGYTPQLTSIEGLASETKLLLHQSL
jgi:nucleoside-diphosphate-sugar epimerase